MEPVTTSRVTTRSPEIHQRALRTVARITFTLGAAAPLGCIEQVPGAVEESDAEPMGAEADGAVMEEAFDAELFGPLDAWAGPAADAGEADAGEADAGEADAGEADAGEVAEARDAEVDAVTDAAPPCPSAEQDHEAWMACCDEVGWGSTDVCFAWGPPNPPAMEVA